MAELYSLMRYLQYDKLRDLSLEHFDAWASTFGETTTSLELAPEGTGYRARTRFAKFHNLPELMSIFKDAADIRTADTLNLPRPEAVYHNVAAKPTEIQQKLVQELSERAAKVSNREVQPNEDNMLVITSDGRKIGLDQRLIDPTYPDDPSSKVNICMENIHRIWEETKDKKSTQLVFSDFSTPGKDKFNVYDDIKTKLIQRGIPKEEIAFIHDADTESQKKELFSKVRKGAVRVLMGSTQKMGAGTNVQDKLIAQHHLDCPWRPSDIAQRDGRIIRQGNENPEVHVYRYVTTGTFDSYLWQTVETKQRFISQVMSSKSPARSCEDVDESVLSYAEVKALCAGNPLIKEKMDLDVEVGKLKIAQSSHQSNIYTLQDQLRKKYPELIKSTEEYIEGLEKDEALSAKTKGAEKFPGLDLVGVRYEEKDAAGKALTELCQTATAHSSLPLGSYRGFEMSARYSEIRGASEITLKGEISHSVALGDSPSGNITRINNVLDNIAERIAVQNEKLADLHKQVETAKEEISRPFPREAELREKLERLSKINADLNLGSGEVQPDEEIPAVEAAKSMFGADEKDSLIGQAKLKLGENAIVTDAQKCRSYSGDVLEVGESYAVQKISRSAGVVHSLNKAPELREMLEAGGKENICVAYDKSGKCSVTPAENSRSQNREEAVSY
jgi:hypothetical protein